MSEFIASRLDEDTLIEESILGTAEPAAIWARILEVRPDAVKCFAFEASVGVLAGVRLADGSRVAIKFHREPVEPAFLDAVQTVQRQLARRGFPCPRPLGVHGAVTVEEWVDEGVDREATEPGVRRVMAAHLAELLRLATELRPLSGLEPQENDALWPRPHNVLFDFEATAAGAEWIDEIARRAKSARETGVRRLVIGHGDWSVKHFRFDGLRPTVIYDWDSLSCDRETVFVGWAAATFTYTEAFGEARSPTLAEAAAFIDDYEEARDEPFEAAEAKAVRAAAVYARAYTSRCVHALGVDAEGVGLREFASALG